MKKLIALLLALAMMMTMLVGCSEKAGESSEVESDESTSAAVSGEPAGEDNETDEGSGAELNEVPVGTMLTLPEKKFDESTTELYVKVVSESLAEGGVEYSFDKTNPDLTILYIVQPSREWIIEESADGKAIYVRMAGEKQFVLASDDEQNAAEQLEFLFDVMKDACAVEYEGLQYKKIEDRDMPAGPAYAYEGYQDGAPNGCIYLFDKATGWRVGAESGGTIDLPVQEIRVGDVKIPDYK